MRTATSSATPRRRDAATPGAKQLTEPTDRFSLVDALDEGAPPGTVRYLEKLAEVLGDGVLTLEEAHDLAEVATAHDLPLRQ